MSLNYQQQKAHAEHVKHAFDNYNTVSPQLPGYGTGNLTGKQWLENHAIPKVITGTNPGMHSKRSYMRAYKKRHDEHAKMMDAKEKEKQAKDNMILATEDMNDPALDGKTREHYENKMIAHGQTRFIAKKAATKAHDKIRTIEQDLVPRPDRLATASLTQRYLTGNRYFRESVHLPKSTAATGNRNQTMKKLGGKKGRKRRTKHRTKRRTKHRTKRRTKHRTKRRTKRRKR
jgi:hypothetical protein